MNIQFKLLILVFIVFIGIVQGNSNHQKRTGQSNAFGHHHRNQHKNPHRSNGNQDEILGEFEYHHYPKYQQHHIFKNHNHNQNGNNGYLGNKYYNNNNQIQIPGKERDKSEVDAQHNRHINIDRYNDKIKKEANGNLQSCSINCHRTYGAQLDQKKQCYSQCHQNFKLKIKPILNTNLNSISTQ